MSAPARLIDLSIARTPEYAARSKRLGTDYYMSPEQADPDTHGTPASPPTSGGSARPCSTRSPAIAPSTRASSDAPELPGRFPQLVDAPYDLPDQVPDAVREVIGAALDRDPDKRPLPSEIVDALSRCSPACRRPADFKVRG